jgi:hypothetical protein
LSTVTAVPHVVSFLAPNCEPIPALAISYRSFSAVFAAVVVLPVASLPVARFTAVQFASCWSRLSR